MMTACDFDKVVDRHHTGSNKWDSHATADAADMIEMWVADMDFKTAPVIIDALQKRVAHGVFGYTYVGEDYYEALCAWFEKRHSYPIDPSMVIYTSGVVPAVSAVIKALANPGDGVILHTPAYNCFFSSIRNNGCRVVESPLLRRDMPDGRMRFEMNFEELERLAAIPDNKLLLLCNPHNPTGRVWTAAELSSVADICRRHGVRVISDEIHCELTMPGFDYNPYGLIDDQAIVCSSPSKAFNTAGLQIANIVAPDASVRRRIDRAININEVCDVNPFGVTALIAAYNHGDRWLDALREYLAGNYDLLHGFFKAELPGYPITALEATYLVWVDIKASGMNGDEIERRMTDDCHVRVASGSIYGNDSFIRLNIAMPRPVLKDALSRIAKFFSSTPAI